MHKGFRHLCIIISTFLGTPVPRSSWIAYGLMLNICYTPGLLTPEWQVKFLNSYIIIYTAVFPAIGLLCLLNALSLLTNEPHGLSSHIVKSQAHNLVAVKPRMHQRHLHCLKHQTIYEAIWHFMIGYMWWTGMTAISLFCRMKWSNTSETFERMPSFLPRAPSLAT